MGIVTYHCLSRAKQRLHKNNKAANKFVNLASVRGRSASDFASMEKNYLNNSVNNGCTVKVYNNFCYIFNQDNICVTLYPLPKWFEKKKHFIGKEKIRNIKKYLKMNKAVVI